MRSLKLLIVLLLSFPASALSQSIEKIVFDSQDTTDGYYLAVQPRSNAIKGALVLCNSFATPESMLPETKLHNVAYANDLLTVFVSVKQKLYADTGTVARLNAVLKHIAATYAVDTAKFVLAGYDFAGTIALRYTELSREPASLVTFRPKAVIGIDSPVDLFGLWKWCERQVKRNSKSAWDADYILTLMTKEQGTIYNRPQQYHKLTPFYAAEDSTGNERYLKNIPLRLYYDNDVEWQLKERQKSLYDTNIPDGSELISRLLALGNKEAELVTAKQPGRNSSGIRTTNSLSIVDEVDCIHWIKNKLDIFDVNTWIPPYLLATPKGWTEERFPIPIEFAPQIRYNGVEDVRFAPGWGNAKSDQYWTYAYLWWLEGTQPIAAPVLQKHLKAYYDGLVARNIKERNIPADKLVTTLVTARNVKTEAGDIATMTGTIRMLDYMTQKPITFNYKAHVKNCIAQSHTAVFIKISPQPFDHSIWMALNQISNRFECGK